VHVLANLNKPAGLGEAISAAFVATLWGVLTANLLWLPIAARLARLSAHTVPHLGDGGVDGGGREPPHPLVRPGGLSGHSLTERGAPAELHAAPTIAFA